MDAERVRSSRAIAHVGWVGTGLTALVAVAGASALLPGMATPAGADLVLLGLLAIAADLRVDGSVHAHRTRFALPFIATICAGFGPTAALLAAVSVVVVGFVASSAFSGRQIQVRSLVGAATGSAICATVAGVGFQALSRSLEGWEAAAQGAILAYVAFHAAVDVGLRRVGVTAPDFEDVGSAPPLLVGALHIALSLAGLVLLRDGAVLLTPLMLGPIFALRSLFVARARLDREVDQTVSTLALMLQRAHPYTHRHIERVAAISERVALRLNLGPARAQMVHRAAILHDVGKIAIDEEILDLPRKLTDDEYEHVKQHARFGEVILREMESLRDVAWWVGLHHERPDGRGYPEGLLDPEIPIESKIIAAVDAFDAMTGGIDAQDGRPFRRAMSADEALDELERCAGSQFDATVVRAFRDVVEVAR